jgi:hypothetical protein
LLALAGAHHFVDLSRIRVKQRESGQDKEWYRTVLKPEASMDVVALANHLYKQLGTGKKFYYEVSVHVKNNIACLYGRNNVMHLTLLYYDLRALQVI